MDPNGGLTKWKINIMFSKSQAPVTTLVGMRAMAIK
jgi:hypothetical protein